MTQNQIEVAQNWISILLIMIALLMIAFMLGRESSKPLPAPDPIIRVGELPYGVPVLVHWIEDDGTVSAASAIRTDYAGVLPYSTTGKAVPYQNIEGFQSWQVLDEHLGGGSF